MAQRKPMLDFISEGDWRLADERQRLLAPLAESENGSVEDVLASRWKPAKAPLFFMINEQNPAYFSRLRNRIRRTTRRSHH